MTACLDMSTTKTINNMTMKELTKVAAPYNLLVNTKDRKSDTVTKL
jgi:hypothetical protein